MQTMSDYFDSFYWYVEVSLQIVNVWPLWRTLSLFNQSPIWVLFDVVTREKFLFKSVICLFCYFFCFFFDFFLFFVCLDFLLVSLSQHRFWHLPKLSLILPQAVPCLLLLVYFEVIQVVFLCALLNITFAIFSQTLYFIYIYILHHKLRMNG